MELLIASILATFPSVTALAPLLLATIALTALAVGLMGLLARPNGHHARQPDVDIVPGRVFIATHEPSFRSMTGRRAAAPSRAPPWGYHLVRSIASSSSRLATASRRA